MTNYAIALMGFAAWTMVLLGGIALLRATVMIQVMWIVQLIAVQRIGI